MRHNAGTSQESRNSSISSSSIQYTWYSCSRFARTCAIASKTPTACSTASRDVNDRHSSVACACRVAITYRNNVGRPRQRQQVLRPQLRLALQGTGGGGGEVKSSGGSATRGLVTLHLTAVSFGACTFTRYLPVAGSNCDAIVASAPLSHSVERATRRTGWPMTRRGEREEEAGAATTGGDCDSETSAAAGAGGAGAAAAASAIAGGAGDGDESKRNAAPDITVCCSCFCFCCSNFFCCCCSFCTRRRSASLSCLKT